MLCSQCGMYYPCVTEGETGTRCITCATPMRFSSADFLGDSPVRFAKEIRQPQIDLAERVELAIEKHQMLVAQAGTGTGKTFALLLPAILSGKVVVVSTATVTLQSQYLQELEFLQRTLKKHDIDFTYAQKKGRGHYLCPIAYQANHKTLKQLTESEDVRLRTNIAAKNFEAVDDWARHTTYGDKAELTLARIDIPKWWPMINADDCLGRKCPKAETCGRMKVNEDARLARIVVANHSIIGFNLKLDMKLLPLHSICLFDEAHKAPGMLQKALADEMSQRAAERVASACAKADLDKYLPDAAALVEELEAEHRTMFDRLLRQVNCKTSATQVEIPKEQLSDSLGGIDKTAAQLQKLLVDFYKFLDKRRKGEMGFSAEDEVTIICQRAREEFPDDDEDGLHLKRRGGYPDVEVVMLALYRVNNYYMALSGFINSGENDVIYLEVPEGNRSPKLCHSPVFIGDILQKRLFSKVPIIVSSSATIPFDWHKMEMGYADTVNMFEVRSPFRYGHRVFIYTTTKVPIHPDRQYPKPLPAERPKKLTEYFDAMTKEIVELCTASKGCAFVLFSARTEMTEMFQRVEPELAKLGFPVKAQEEGTSPIGLEKWYRGEKNPVLFGLRSFWEGVDIPGDHLRLVILTKLPFPLQGDLVLNAKKKLMKQRGCSDTFVAIDVPDMVMNVLQIFGRLIRTATDYGVFALLDRKFTRDWFSPSTYSNKLYNLLPTSPDGAKMKVTSNIADVQQMFKAAGVK